MTTQQTQTKEQLYAPTDKSTNMFLANISRTLFLKGYCSQSEENMKTYDEIFETFRDGMIESKNN